MLVALCFFGSVFGGVTSLLEARSRREYMGVFRSKGSPSVGSPADFASQRWFRGAFKAPYGVVSLPSVPAGQCLWLWASFVDAVHCPVRPLGADLRRLHDEGSIRGWLVEVHQPFAERFCVYLVCVRSNYRLA